jgi:hypothetical protein
MLSNEVFALACRAYYDEIGLVVDASNGEFAHSPLTRKECDTGYYLLHGHHQHQGLLQSRDLDKCCFYNVHTLTWLRELDYFPAEYFELWDIYEKYASKKSKQNVKKTNLIIHAEKNEEGKSVHSVEINKKIHAKKNKEGKSEHAVKMGAASVAATTPEQRSERARKGSKATHARKNSEGKSIHASEMGKKGGRKGGLAASSQVWESTIDGFRSTAGNVAQHNRRNGWDPNARFRVK